MQKLTEKPSFSQFLLFEVPEGAAEPERHAQLCDLDDDGTHVEAVVVDRQEPTHHVEHQEADD